MICSFNGIRAFVRAASKASASSRRDIAAVFAEVMIHPKQREKLRQAGRLLVLPQFHRNRDPEMRVHTEKALHYVGDMLDIYFTLAQDLPIMCFVGNAHWTSRFTNCSPSITKKDVKENPMIMITEPEKVKERAREEAQVDGKAA